MIVLRQRQKAAERHICKYRNSAEESVESMLERLYTLRREQEELDKKLEHATDQIKQKESLIKLKEQEKARVQTDIMNDQDKHNKNFSELRNTLQK